MRAGVAFRYSIEMGISLIFSDCYFFEREGMTLLRDVYTKAGIQGDPRRDRKGDESQ